MANRQVVRKSKLKRSFKQWLRGGGMRPVAAAALLLVVLIFVPNTRTESNTALASNADQPRYVDMLCDNWGIVFYLTAPTQTSPTVTNYEYAYSTTEISARPLLLLGEMPAVYFRVRPRMLRDAQELEAHLMSHRASNNYPPRRQGTATNTKYKYK